MATFSQTGKRARITGMVDLSASGPGNGQWEAFKVSVREEGNFPGNRSFRWHEIQLDRVEAERLAKYLTARLADKLDKYGNPQGN
jgi:hypothetical protein